MCLEILSSSPAPQNRPKANSISYMSAELGSTHHWWAPHVLPVARLPVWASQVLQVLCLVSSTHCECSSLPAKVLIDSQPAPDESVIALGTPYPSLLPGGRLTAS